MESAFKHRPIKFFLLLASSLFLATSCPAQSFNQLLFDGDQSQYFGAENLISLHKFLYRAEDRVLPDNFSDESTPGQKALGIGYRSTKLLLLDQKVDYLHFLIQHEVFGHGSRYRELGVTDLSYEINLPFPFGSGAGLTTSSFPSNFITSSTERQMVTAAGMEANSLLAHQFEYRWLQDKAMHYRQSLLYLHSRNDVMLYIWSVKLFNQDNTFSTKDPSSWVFDINQHFGSLDRSYSLDRIAIQSLITLLNPFQLYAAFALGKTYLLDGNRYLKKLPTLQIGRLQYLPALSFNLTPFGSEFILNNYLQGEHRLIDIQVNIGDPLFHRFHMLSANVHDLFYSELYRVGLHIGAWDQPKVTLGGTSISEHQGGIGGFCKLQLALFPIKRLQKFGLYSSVGYKTTGYLMGEKLDENMIIRFGAAFRLEN